MAKYQFMKPCAKCGVLSKGNLCPQHEVAAQHIEALRQAARKKERKHYSGAYSRLAKIVRDNALICHICGEGAKYGDPFEADHIIPTTVVTDITQLAPAHRSCNLAKGNRLPDNPRP